MLPRPGGARAQSTGRRRGARADVCEGGEPERSGRLAPVALPTVSDWSEVWEEEAHQPFQKIPDEWNARVDAFWREVEGR